MTTKEQLTKHDREIAAIRTLIKTGMHMLVRLEDLQQRNAADIRNLTAAQKKTDASLKALIDQLRRSGGNGHAKGKVDLQ